MKKKSVLLYVLILLFSSCNAFYMGKDKSSVPSESDERIYADLGSYDDENPTLDDYVQNDYHNSNYYKSNNPQKNINVNNNLDYKARPKSINNYDYERNSPSLSAQRNEALNSKTNLRSDTHGNAEEKKGFFGRLYGSVKDFFIIQDNEIQGESPRGSLNTQKLSSQTRGLSKRADWMGRLHFPVNHPEATLTSAFGWRKGKFHEGIDVAAPYGSVVEAAYDAKVLYSGDLLGGYGNMAVLQSKDGLVTVYSHNAKLYVKKGDVVRRGEVIALLGDSGNATAPHLHFEVRLANPNGDFVAVNPEGLFQ